MTGSAAVLYRPGRGCHAGPVGPRVRYTDTPAGRVAWSVSGSGPPLVCDPGWITHLRAQLDLCAFGDVTERLAERFTVIRFDKPGCGLSDRERDRYCIYDSDTFHFTADFHRLHGIAEKRYSSFIESEFIVI